MKRKLVTFQNDSCHQHLESTAGIQHSPTDTACNTLSHFVRVACSSQDFPTIIITYIYTLVKVKFMFSFACGEKERRKYNKMPLACYFLIMLMRDKVVSVSLPKVTSTSIPPVSKRFVVPRSAMRCSPFNRVLSGLCNFKKTHVSRTKHIFLSFLNRNIVAFHACKGI